LKIVYVAIVDDYRIIIVFESGYPGFKVAVLKQFIGKLAGV
jgi:hypothetical protein